MTREQHAFIAKINARLKALSNKFGLSKDEITDSINLDGVYVTDKGNIAVDPSMWSPELVKDLESKIRTVSAEQSEAIERLRNFVGPLHTNDIKREVQAKFKVEELWEDIREKYYEVEGLLTQIDSDVIDKLANFGTDFYNEDVSYTDLMNFKDMIMEEIEHELR